MISTETPYKLAEIIRDTWPQLYRPPMSLDKPPKVPYDDSESKEEECNK